MRRLWRKRSYGKFSRTDYWITSILIILGQGKKRNSVNVSRMPTVGGICKDRSLISDRNKDENSGKRLTELREHMRGPSPPTGLRSQRRLPGNTMSDDRQFPDLICSIRLLRGRTLRVTKGAARNKRVGAEEPRLFEQIRRPHQTRPYGLLPDPRVI